MIDILIVVDTQNDFVDEVLNPHIISNIANKIVSWAKEHPKGRIYFTMNISNLNNKSPLCPAVTEAFKEACKIMNNTFEDNDCDCIMRVLKNAFGSIHLAETLQNDEYPISSVEIIGLYTDTSVISNALIVRSCFPSQKITIDARCCAGSTIDKHHTALKAMKSCFIDIINE